MSGPIVVFLCSNLGNGPTGTQMCPAAPATISGTFTAAGVLGGAAGQGLEAGNLEELIAALVQGPPTRTCIQPFVGPEKSVGRSRLTTIMIRYDSHDR